MLRTALILACCFCASVLHAATSTVWSPGVNGDSGWEDYDKTEANASLYGSVGGMCWAATSANVLSWWYKQNGLTATIVNPLDGKSYNPWEVYQMVYADYGWNPQPALNWWINGNPAEYNFTWGYDGAFGGYDMKEEVYDSTSYDAKEKIFPNEWYYGGFLKDDYNTALASIFVSGSDSNDIYVKSAAIVGALEDGYALSLSVPGHAFTLWGVEYQETEDGLLLTEAYITDSDDKLENQLIRAKVETNKGVLRLYGMEYYDQAGMLIAERQNQTFDITRADGMRCVPEPTTTVLTLLALAGVAMRRRRIH